MSGIECSSQAKGRRGKRQKRGDDSSKHYVKKYPTPVVTTEGVLEFPLEPLKEHLTCILCKGYLRCAHTISECLHSFCKSCLFCVYNRGITKCPECNVNLGPDPYSVTLFDRTLQELVDKVFPELQLTDEAEERKYYQINNIKPRKEYAAEIEKATAEDADDVALGLSNGCEKRDDKVERRSSLKRKSTQSSPSKPEVKIPVPPDEINIELHPEIRQSYLQKKRTRSSLRRSQKEEPASKDMVEKSGFRIRTSGRLKIAQLKKYIIKINDLDDNQQSTLGIRCNGDVVGDELSLTFILRTRASVGETLSLTYFY